MSNQHKKTDISSILSNITLFNREIAEGIGKEVFLKMHENPGMTLKQATGVSDDALEEIYSLAYTFYNQGKYPESLTLFQFLSGTSPETYKYALGLGGCFHQMKNYEEAAAGFFLALNLDPLNPMPAYYVTDCFLKQNLDEEALEFAQITLMICEDKPEYSELKHRCELMISSLKNKLNH